MPGPNEVIVCKVCKSFVQKGDKWIPTTVWDAYKTMKYEGVCSNCEKAFNLFTEFLAEMKKKEEEQDAVDSK